jgi:hypothetical protein
MFSLLLTIAVGVLLRELRHSKSSVRRENTRLFWNALFNPSQDTIVLHGDSGFVMLQDLTKRRIDLDDYLSGAYLKHLPPSPYSTEQLSDLGRRRHTSIVDVSIENRIFRPPGIYLDRTQFHYARDLRIDDIKQANLVLLGTYESTPWVKLFESSMNFYFENNLSAGVFSAINRNPRNDELARYNYVPGDSRHTVYGLIAYRPSLSA